MRTIDKNKLFYRLLRAVKDETGKRPKWTVEKIAESIYVNRCHLTDVLNNKPGHGGQIRPKLVRFFRENFEQWRAILQALGWDEDGRIVPRGMLDVQHSTGNNAEPEGKDV